MAIIEGTDGPDVLPGSPESDEIFGRAGDDAIDAGEGDDLIVGGSGDDQIDGGPGLDHIDLSDFGDSAGALFQGVQVNLAQGVAIDGWNNTDTISNVEWVFGTDFGDSLIGDSNSNGLYGRAGADTLGGGDGDDILSGGSGDDQIDGGPGFDRIDFFDNGDSAGPPTQGVVVNLALNLATDSWGDTDTITGIEWVFGSEFADSLTGDSEQNALRGLDGDDELYGGAGNDNLVGGAGDDVLDGGEGLDLIRGSSGADTFANGHVTYATDSAGVRVNLSSTSQLAGATLLDPRTGSDGWGDLDAYGDGVERGNASPYDDYWFGSDADTDTLTDIRTGLMAGDDFAVMGTGNDVVGPGSGSDTIDGGGGIDTIDYSVDEGLAPFELPRTRGVQADLGTGEIVDAWGDTDTVFSIENVIGTMSDDILIGDGNDNVLTGSGGDDTVDGGDGVDTVKYLGVSSDYDVSIVDGVATVTDLNTADGDDGTDTLSNIEQLQFSDTVMVLQALVEGTPGDDVLDLSGPGGGQALGGAGDDVFIVDDPDDEPIELPDEGIDTVQASLSFSLGDNLENLTLVGVEAIDGTGNELDNVIEGNEAANVLDGKEGADTLQGGLGSDTYLVDNENDQVVETGNSIIPTRFGSGVPRRRGGEPFPDIRERDVADDIDEVISTVTYALSEFVENLTLTGSDSINGSGNELDNTIVGNASDNVLSTGTGGNDSLNGGDGDDYYVVDNLSGTIRIDDTAGGDNTLDISGFMVTDNVSEFTYEEATGDTLIIRNASTGVIEVPDFFADETNPIRSIDVGAGAVDVSGVSDPQSLARLLDPVDPISLLVDGEPYYQSRVEAADGEMIEAVQAQTFRQYLGGLGREPVSASGLSFWLSKADDGSRENMKLMARGFINTGEFQAKADADGDSIITDEEFVDHMFFNVFGRAPAEGGKNFWLNAIDRSEQAVAFMDMLQSPEFVLNHAVTVSDWAFWDGIA